MGTRERIKKNERESGAQLGLIFCTFFINILLSKDYLITYPVFKIFGAVETFTGMAWLCMEQNNSDYIDNLSLSFSFGPGLWLGHG